MSKAEVDLAPWLSAALEDYNTCAEFKQVIQAWFDSKVILIDEPSEEMRRIEEEMWNSLSK